MSNLYHRDLLSSFEVTEIGSLLDAAISYVDHEITLSTGELQVAFSVRLELRRALLTAVNPDPDLSAHDQAQLWDQCLNLLPLMLKTKPLGATVDISSNAKIQRRLASSIPPRPIVKICFDDAYEYLRQLCQNGKEVYQILEHPSGNNCIVRH